MLGRKQEINLQLTELLDSALLAFCLWFGHFLRADLVPVFFPDAVEIPTMDKFYWVVAVVAPHHHLLALAAAAALLHQLFP